MAKKTSVATSVPAPATLKRYYDGAGPHPHFRFLRAWYDGDGQRGGIAETVLKKLKPGDDPHFGLATKYEVLLPASAPSEYMSVALLLERYDAVLPQFGVHAFAQITVDLSTDEPLHVFYERVRRYAHTFTAQGLAVVLVLHVPSAALSANLPHCHLIIPARSLTAHGFGAAATLLCSDVGNAQAWEAWQQHGLQVEVH